jgi:hypothetical protein
MEILGHSHTSMTSPYAYVLPQVMTDAAERIGQALWGETRAQLQPSWPVDAVRATKVHVNGCAARDSNPEPAD